MAMLGAAALIICAFYFAPLIVALARGHQQTGAIFVINFFLGWTLIGWVVAMAMACSAKMVPATQTVVNVGGGSSADATKICPRCAETVKAAATVCRFCNYEFVPTSAVAGTAPGASANGP
ncbi:MAG: superinfection immunity protein [Rhizomicrobium sp.]